MYYICIIIYMTCILYIFAHILYSLNYIVLYQQNETCFLCFLKQEGMAVEF